MHYNDEIDKQETSQGETFPDAIQTLSDQLIYAVNRELNYLRMNYNVSDAEASFFGFTFIYIGWFCED